VQHSRNHKGTAVSAYRRVGVTALAGRPPQAESRWSGKTNANNPRRKARILEIAVQRKRGQRVVFVGKKGAVGRSATVTLGFLDPKGSFKDSGPLLPLLPSVQKNVSVVG